RALCDALGVAEVRVPFEEGDPGGLFGVGSGVAEYVEPVPDVDHVDQPVTDDWEAPDDHLVRACRERRVLVRNGGQRRGREPAGVCPAHCVPVPQVGNGTGVSRSSFRFSTVPAGTWSFATMLVSSTPKPPRR